MTNPRKANNLHEHIPASFPVRPLTSHQTLTAKDRVVCLTCGLAWDDSIPTSYTPAPSARCPFEAFHKTSPQQRLEYLREEIRAERISYGEIAELQSLSDYINPGDVELLQWAGIEEEQLEAKP